MTKKDHIKCWKAQKVTAFFIHFCLVEVYVWPSPLENCSLSLALDMYVAGSQWNQILEKPNENLYTWMWYRELWHQREQAYIKNGVKAYPNPRKFHSEISRSRIASPFLLQSCVSQCTYSYTPMLPQIRRSSRPVAELNFLSFIRLCLTAPESLLCVLRYP